MELEGNSVGSSSIIEIHTENHTIISTIEDLEVISSHMISFDPVVYYYVFDFGFSNVAGSVEHGVRDGLVAGTLVALNERSLVKSQLKI